MTIEVKLCVKLTDVTFVPLNFILPQGSLEWD